MNLDFIYNSLAFGTLGKVGIGLWSLFTVSAMILSFINYEDYDETPIMLRMMNSISAGLLNVIYLVYYPFTLI